MILSVLTQFFNLSIAKSDFSSPFKLAKAIPIHKFGPKAVHSNYRPISILTITSLILERHVNVWLKQYKITVIKDNQVLENITHVKQPCLRLLMTG